MKKLSLSRRALNTPPSPIRRLTPLAAAAQVRGTQVYPLNIGQPDIASPLEYFEGLKRYREQVVAYEGSQGRLELRQAWSKYFERSIGLAVKPEQLLITTGASEALIFLFMCCADPGDEILVFDPTYANYIGFAAIAGVKLVPVPSKIENNFALPEQREIESHLTAKTKAILLCNPNNPTGTVYTRLELERLLAICNERELFLLLDETYRELVFDGIKPLSVLHLAAGNERVIVVDSLSKRFSLCGARLGCLITCNEQVLAATLNLAQARLASPTLEQAAAGYMLDVVSSDLVPQVCATYARRRDALFGALAKIPGVVAHKPHGAFYCVAKLPVHDAERFASFLLSDFSHEGATTFVAPANGFYVDQRRGRDEIRLAYVIAEDQIVKAVEILGRGLEAYSE